MKMRVAPARIRAGILRLASSLPVCILLTTALLSCTGASAGPDADERVAEQEARTHTLEESLEALENENAELRGKIATIGEDMDDLESRIQELEETDTKLGADLATIEMWSKTEEDKQSLAEEAVHEATARMVEQFGDQVHYMEHTDREVPSVLVTPVRFVDGETPLIVSLHGFGGNSADHAAYVPLHERVNSHGFALLLPTGALGSNGNAFWNPTDLCCLGGKTGEDDVAFLSELVANAREVREFGRVYFFGYSNGGFMSYHMACKGLPGLRAVVSLAGTSFVEDSSCEGAPPVSVLHIHGTADEVILFGGDEIETVLTGNGKRVFYAGAQEMVMHWSRRAGCNWPEDLQPYATLDLDGYVPGAETQAFRVESGCAEGITIELWAGEGSGHSPGFGETFLDAMVDWLLSQE